MESSPVPNKPGVSRTRSRNLLILAVGCSFAAGAIVTFVMLSTIRVSLAGAAQPTNPRSLGQAETLTVGVGRIPGGLRQWNAYMAILSRLEDDLGRPVTIRLMPDESAIADVFVDGDIDLALVTLSAYLRLEDEGAAQLVAAPVIGGQAENSAMLVVRNDSGFETLDDLRGARIAFRPDSIGGDAYASWLLGARGETPASFFGELIESDSHDSGLDQVARGEVDAVFVRRWDLFGWSEDAFRSVAESPPFAMPPVVARDGLDPELLERILASLTTSPSAETSSKSNALEGFVRVTAEDYAFARLLAVQGSSRKTTGGSQP
jgi:phosphonate transport system substrate-binding protein